MPLHVNRTCGWWRAGFSPRGASAPLPNSGALASLPPSGTEVPRGLKPALQKRLQWPTIAALLSISALPAVGASWSYHVTGGDAAAWAAVLGSLGLAEGPANRASVEVAGPGTSAARIAPGGILILEGESPLASSYGFRATSNRVVVSGVEDLRAPQLQIVWEEAADVPVFEVPKQAQVFARERWLHAPLMAGFRQGENAVLWIATSPGARGYERFPYLPQALAELGLDPPFRSRNLWAFFDSSYRLRADVDYLAPKWRAAGIAALQVAAWHYWEPDPASDEYLRRLIDACHRNAILVYAWFELPHVSEKFWAEHPDWREKTALLQDAQLDWRKLMNLERPEAFQAVSAGMRELIERFDWDGVNLAELYFESLEGADNPARFTPMNDDVRAAFRRSAGFDPAELFDQASAHYGQKNAADLREFLNFRAGLAHDEQARWIMEVERARKSKPHLDLVLTHVDDRFDFTMRAKIGADASRALRLLDDHDFTFLIEDPATIWNLGPKRYAEIAARYQPLTARQDKLAIDINIVERYQDVYPTKQQTGAELFELTHEAAMAFPRVALYFESSIAKLDWPLLAASAAAADRAEQDGAKVTVRLRRPAGVRWKGSARVDGRPWPVANGEVIWLPPGTHTIEPVSKAAPARVLDFNGELISAAIAGEEIQLAYRASARVLAVLDHTPGKLEIDRVEMQPVMQGNTLVLPKGQHLVTLAGP